jgi:hypothetical protein
VEQGESPFFTSFKICAPGVLMTGSTAHQDESELKRALQLGVILTIIVLAVVLSWQR